VLHDSTANSSLVRLLVGPRWRIGLRDLALLGERAGPTSPPATAAIRSLDVRRPARRRGRRGGSGRTSCRSSTPSTTRGDLGYDPEALRRFAPAVGGDPARFVEAVGDPLRPTVVHRIVTATGARDRLAASPELLLLHRAEGLAAFVDLVAGFADSEGDASIAPFLAWLANAARYDAGWPELDRPPHAPDAVQLMTVHRSKGLEWPVVVLPSLTARVFPSGRGIARWRRRPASAVPYPLRGDADSLPVLAGVSARDDRGVFVAECP